MGSWGLRGHVKVQVLTDFPERFLPGETVHLAGKPRRITDQKQRKEQMLLKLAGIDNPQQAASLRGRLLTIPEEGLEPLGEDQFYRYQLLGCRAVRQDGGELGKVIDILDTGETQVLVVAGGEGGEMLVPLIEDYVTSVDIQTSTVNIDLATLLGDES